MTLILLKAPRDALTSMADTKIVKPGGHPPLISPHCMQCRIPVEAFEIDPVSSTFYLGVEANCHGKTTGIKLPVEAALKAGIVWISFP